MHRRVNMPPKRRKSKAIPKKGTSFSQLTQRHISEKQIGKRRSKVNQRAKEAIGIIETQKKNISN